jgi:hypothetical protein
VITGLDLLLRRLLTSEVPSISSDDQVRFQPPDQDWRTAVAGLGDRNALNVYLFEMRENRRLRTNERERRIENGITVDMPAPRRVDCHYLITAWSAASVTPAVEPTLDEHQLLYEVTAALIAHESLVPRQVFAPGALPAGFPPALADAELPTTLLPVEGFAKYAEFWGTMGNVHPWKPAVYLVVTLPVLLKPQEAGPPVTTLSTTLGVAGRPETMAQQLHIGGLVLDARAAPAQPVARAWVRLETDTGNPAVEGVPLGTGETDGLGRFRFGPLPAGQYRLRVRARGLGEQLRGGIPVPSPSGAYDVQFT